MFSIDYIYSVIVFVGGLVLYVMLKMPQFRKQMDLGLLLYAYIRDISKLLSTKMAKDWVDLSMPQKLDMLKAIYDLVEELSNVQIESPSVPNSPIIDDFLKERQ